MFNNMNLKMKYNILSSNSYRKIDPMFYPLYNNQSLMGYDRRLINNYQFHTQDFLCIHCHCHSLLPQFHMYLMLYSNLHHLVQGVCHHIQSWILWEEKILCYMEYDLFSYIKNCQFFCCRVGQKGPNCQKSFMDFPISIISLCLWLSIILLFKKH